MNLEDFKNLAFEMTGYFKNDSENVPVNSGDILIRKIFKDEEIKKIDFNFSNSKFFQTYEYFLKNVDLDESLTENEKQSFYQALRKNNIIHLNGFNDPFSKIYVAEYFKIPFLNSIKLFLHGFESSFHIEQYQPKNDDKKNVMSNYYHFSLNNLNNEIFGYISTLNLFDEHRNYLVNYDGKLYKGDKKIIKSILQSRFGKNFKILGSFTEFIFVKFKIINHIAVKKAIKMQKGVLYRQNWYTKLFSQFPYLHFYVNKTNLLQKYQNKICNDESFIQSLFDIMYTELDKNKKKKSFNIFCTRTNDVNDKSKIYFWKS